MTQFSRKKIIAQKSSTDLTSTNSRITNLENNEYKVTYYEIISGASGSLTLPTGATINAGEFGLSGNCVLSKIDGSNKPTFESPKTAGGTVVTASLNETTGAWVASGVYTDANVALIYSIKIKAIYYSNLTYANIIETVNDIPTVDTTIIDGSTNAVSGNAVFDGLATKADNLLAKQNITITHTGTTANTIINPSTFLSGFEANDFLLIEARIAAVNNANNKQFRLYFNTSHSLTGATLIATNVLTSGTQGNVFFSRTLTIGSNLTTNSIFSTTTSIINDKTYSGTIGLTALNYNLTNGVYLIIAAQLPSSAADTLTLYDFKARIER